MYWEELLFAIIGEQFDVGHEICGAVVSIRADNDIISVWNKSADNPDATNKIRLVSLVLLISKSNLFLKRSITTNIKVTIVYSN